MSNFLKLPKEGAIMQTGRANRGSTSTGEVLSCTPLESMILEALVWLLAIGITPEYR